MKISFFLLALIVVAVVDGKRKSKISKRTATTCAANEFLCSNGQCIPQYYLCDTMNDCGNNEDEVGCPTDCSGPHQVQCNNGDCEPLEFRCDGFDDCLDNSDETGCETYKCPVGKTMCPNTYFCIDSRYLCDGDNDCTDNWDEQPQNCHSSAGR